MEWIKEHIKRNLTSLLGESHISFDEVINSIQRNSETDYRGLLSYLDNIIYKVLFKVNDGLNVLHIHFEDDLNDAEKLLIAEYILIKIFKQYQSIDNSTDETDFSLQELLSCLEVRQNTLEARCPDGASGKNGGNRIWKQWIQDKKNNGSLLSFYKSLKESSTLKIKSLFNSQINFSRLISQLFEFRPFITHLSSKHKSYNLLNTSQTLNEIDKLNNEIIDEIESIVLFDCDRKKTMANFSLEEINKWNSDYETKFKNYLIFSFGRESHSLNSIRNKIDTITDRFKTPLETTYTILSSEIDFLLKRIEKKTITLQFVGFVDSSIWDTFLLETSIRELYELRSIKLMNIYSICFNEEIKNYIMEDLFSKNESSELISLSTKQALLELRDEDISLIQEALSNTLDLIINLGIKMKIINKLANLPTIIIDAAIIKNPKLVLKFSKAIDMPKSIKFKSWSELTSSTSNSIIILSYRDQGKFPNHYYPNLIEFEYTDEATVEAIMPNFLFRNHYNWAYYQLLKNYHKYLNHPIRKNYFEWNKLKNTIEKLRPELKLNIDWNLENEFSNSEHRETYKIKFKGHKSKTSYISDLFIIRENKGINYKVVKTDYILSLDLSDGKYYIQKLDEIQEDINIYEKIADTKQQEEELDIIRKQFNLGHESAGRLWKVLLKNIADIEGGDQLYNDLKIHFERKGLKIVSLFHFKNSWINPLSESIAPLSKRAFIEICEYLNIPKIYFVIIQRIRNASKQSTRQSTRQMNQLLKDLFNDGCFDLENNARDIINRKLSYYKKYHPLDELGIDENNLADNLVTLTELIQPELKLLELETIEKIEQ